MRHVRIFLNAKGPYTVWEEPAPGVEYILGADVALGRDRWLGKQDGNGSVGDTSTIVIMRREGQRLIQVAQARARLEASVFGAAVASWGKHYNHALINIERNLADAPWAALQRAQYPLERLYIQPDSMSTTGSYTNRVFTSKTRQSSKILMDTLLDYLMVRGENEEARLVIRSQELAQEIRTVTKNDRGMMDSTNGKDLVVALMMAVLADDTTPPQLKELPPPPKVPRAPWNVDADGWKEFKGIDEEKPVYATDPAGYSLDRSMDLPEFKDDQKPYGD